MNSKNSHPFAKYFSVPKTSFHVRFACNLTSLFWRGLCMRSAHGTQSNERNKLDHNDDRRCERAHVLMSWFVIPAISSARVAERGIQGKAR